MQLRFPGLTCGLGLLEVLILRVCLMALIKRADKSSAVKKVDKGKKNGEKAVVRKDAAVKKRDAAARKPVSGRLEQVRSYLRGVINELKKVHWPTRREVIIYTAVVLVTVSVVGVMIWIFDFLLSLILKLIIR